MYNNLFDRLQWNKNSIWVNKNDNTKSLQYENLNNTNDIFLVVVTTKNVKNNMSIYFDKIKKVILQK